MKSEIIKSRLDLVKYALAVALSLGFVLTNLVGFSQNIFIIVDSVTSPGINKIHSFGVNTNIFFTELMNKNQVLDDNLKLKSQISDLESIKAENETLKQKLEEQEKRLSISSSSTKNFKVVNVRGIQDLYNSLPSVYISLDFPDQYRVGQVVYYNKNQLFGTISEISGLSAKVIPFYSPELNFRVPAQSSTAPNVTGFIVPIKDGEVRISNINRDANVSSGDIWVTTNDRANIPGALVLGKVKNVFEDRENGFKEIQLEPPFDLLTLENLLIVPNE